MRELRDRLAKAAVGDRHLDADMHEVFGARVVRDRPHPARCFAYLVDSRWVTLPSVTTNIKDAIGFVDNVARGADIELRRHGREWIASVGWSGKLAHRSAAVALCLALLDYKLLLVSQSELQAEAAA
jgi:hypothetical protein